MALETTKETLTFRLNVEKKKKLDKIANDLDRDRSYVINEAIENYLELHTWQIDHIKEGLEQAEKGKFASETQVDRAFKR